MFVVHYLLDGHFRCTRHAPGCYLLTKTQRMIDAGGDPRFSGLAIFEDARYSLPNRRRLKDHRCVAKFMEENPPECQTTPPTPLQPTLELV